MREPVEFLPPQPAPVPDIGPVTNTMRINARLLAQLDAMDAPARYPLQLPVLPPGVGPRFDPEARAEDGDGGEANSQQLLQYASQYGCGVGFPGYPYLAQLLQRSEYYEPPAVIANELTRKWVRIVAQGKSGKDGATNTKIEGLQKAFEDFNVQHLWRHLANVAGQFGRAQLFVDIAGQEKQRRLPLVIKDAGAIKTGSLAALRVIEPMWSMPWNYNSIDPTRPDFYKPQMWYIMSERIHASRLLTIIPKPVPDLLKSAYNFGGLSLTQLSEITVRNWLETRDSVNRLINNFSTLKWMTNLETVLQGGTGEELFARVKFFQKMRKNDGVVLLDKNTEELATDNVPLSNLDKLQAQAQEHMSMVTHIPLVKLTGITPSGLNASSDGEIRVFYDWIASEFNAHYREALMTVLRLLQLNLWGTIDETITVRFEELYELTKLEAAQVRKADADTANVYVQAGVLDPQEPRDKLTQDPDSGYNHLEGEAPGLPDNEDDTED